MPTATSSRTYTTIVCESCGQQQARVDTRYAHKTKYCQVCQVLRDARLRPVKSRECALCGCTFYPIRSHGTWRLCGECVYLGVDTTDFPPCKACKEPYPPAPGLTDTCVRCVQFSADNRQNYYRRIRKLTQQRLATKKAAGSVL